MESQAVTLYDMPVSNNGARVRILIYAKGLDTSGEVSVVPPTSLGGLKSPEYLKLNPQGKMPMMTIPDGPTLYESDTIARYVMDIHSDKQPTFVPSTPQARALDNLIARVHDIYITTIQSCMYRAAPPFGQFHSRWEALAEVRKQIQVVAGLAADEGPFLTGAEIGLSDASFFPTMVFMRFMLPKFVPQGETWSEESTFGPKLMKWWKHMTTSEPAAGRVLTEIEGALQNWEQAKRWDSILFAGRRDEGAPTIFDKIIRKEIPSDVVYEDDLCVAFKDISPVAPTHLLVIPKRREGLTQLRYSSADHEYILGHLLRVAGEQGKAAVGEGGFRIVINDGAQAAQSVFHLHVHVVGGRQMTWPPG